MFLCLCNLFFALQGKDALMIDQDDFDAITDKIPQKPMTAAEGVSYTAIILAAFGVGAA